MSKAGEYRLIYVLNPVDESIAQKDNKFLAKIVDDFKKFKVIHIN